MNSFTVRNSSCLMLEATKNAERQKTQASKARGTELIGTFHLRRSALRAVVRKQCMDGRLTRPRSPSRLALERFVRRESVKWSNDRSPVPYTFPRAAVDRG